MLTHDTYKRVYLEGIEELTDLNSELSDLKSELSLREERCNSVESRILDVKRGVLALASLCDEVPWVTYPDLFPELDGLTDAIRNVLRQAPAGMSPVGIRDRLKNVRYQTKSKNILSSIHTVLKRLTDAGEVENNGNLYQYKPKPVTGDPVSEASQSKTGEKQNGKAKD